MPPVDARLEHASKSDRQAQDGPGRLQRVYSSPRLEVMGSLRSLTGLTSDPPPKDMVGGSLTAT